MTGKAEFGQRVIMVVLLTEGLNLARYACSVIPVTVSDAYMEEALQLTVTAEHTVLKSTAAHTQSTDLCPELRCTFHREMEALVQMRTGRRQCHAGLSAISVQMKRTPHAPSIQEAARDPLIRTIQDPLDINFGSS